MDSGTLLGENIWRSGGHAVNAERVNYFEDSLGYLCRPVEKGPFPEIVVIHWWWGLNSNIHAISGRLASHGYTCLAVDLFNGHIAAGTERAKELSGSLDPVWAIENMQSAVAFLRIEHNAQKIASIGWCFGGGQSMKLALSGEKLDATIIYYGNAQTNHSGLSAIKWPVLGIFGQDDAISVQKVREFERQLIGLKIPNEIIIYPKAGHAFADPSNPAFAPTQARDAWEKTLEFLRGKL